MATAEVLGFTLVDFSVPNRDTPVVHPVADAPVHSLSYGKRVDASFFDPNCPEGQEILQDPKTSIAELFAIVRQWVPQIQKNMNTLMKEILRRGAHVDDRDGLTDQTLLHYACKAGAGGVGDEAAAVAVVQSLLAKGADLFARCRWTNMTPLHYAAFFNCPRLVKCLLKASNKRGINDVAVEFDKGTALHIAAAGLGKEVVELLLENGADARIEDEQKRKPWQCVPLGDDASPDQQEKAAAIVQLLQDASETRKKPVAVVKPKSAVVKPKSGAASSALKLGDRVIVGGSKCGTLRFFGTSDFAPGEWAGVELDDAVGKNNGSVQGKVYFTCPPKHGLFAPLSKVSKAPASVAPPSAIRPLPASFRSSSATPTQGERELQRHTETPLLSSANGAASASSAGAELNDTSVKVGDQVVVAGSKRGILHFVGQTKFAPGIWMGIELDQPIGKNDGSVGGVQYFTCKPKYGVFAPESRVTKAPDIATGTDAVRPRQTDSQSSATVATASTTTAAASTTTVAASTTTAAASTTTVAAASSTAPLTPKKERTTRRPRPLSRQSQSGSTGSLAEGTTVLVNGEMGVLRYIGSTEFADGTWLGIELKQPVGKNDGSVKGKRYFSCKANFGILVRPSRATVRGISAAKLLAEGSGQ